MNRACSVQVLSSRTSRIINIGLLLLMAITLAQTVTAQPYAVLIRHGEGIHNVEHFYSTNPEHPNYKPAPLTPKGVQQAADRGKQLKQQGITTDNILAIYSSPLPRAVQTAEGVISPLYLDKAQIQVIQEIKETQLGNREGKNVHSFNEKDFWFPKDPASFGAETNDSVQKRMVGAWNDAAEKFADKSGYVLFVSHGSPLFLLIEAIEGKGKRLGNAEAYIIHLKPLPESQSK